MSNPMQSLEDSELGRIVIANYECPVCLEVLKPPVNQCTNGHLICNECVQRMHVCPVCREELPSDPIRNLAFEKLLEAMYLFCPHVGCHVKYGREHRDLLERHVLVCPIRGRRPSYRSPPSFGGAGFLPSPTWSHNINQPPGLLMPGGPDPFNPLVYVFPSDRTATNWPPSVQLQNRAYEAGFVPMMLVEDEPGPTFISEPFVPLFVIDTRRITLTLQLGPPQQVGDFLLLDPRYVGGPTGMVPVVAGPSSGVPAPVYGPRSTRPRYTYQDPGQYYNIQSRYGAPLLDQRPVRTAAANASGGGGWGHQDRSRIPMPSHGQASTGQACQASSQPQGAQSSGIDCQHQDDSNPAGNS